MSQFKVTVEFCMQWNYSPKAARFAEGLFNHFRYQVTELVLTPSSGGVFEVTINGTKIYSKKETGVFPDVQEIIAQMEKM